jgi:hypothetical protein
VILLPPFKIHFREPPEVTPEILFPSVILMSDNLACLCYIYFLTNSRLQELKSITSHDEFRVKKGAFLDLSHHRTGSIVVNRAVPSCWVYP